MNRHPFAHLPRRRARAGRPCGFTLVELLIVVAVVAIILVLAAPSFGGLIEMQRLRGTAAQVVTDMQFVRTETLSRQQPVVVRMGARTSAPVGTCYVIYTCNLADFSCPCNCSSGAGSACTADSQSPARWAEIRTVEIASSSGVAVIPVVPNGYTDAQIRFDPVSGGVTGFIAAPGTGMPNLDWSGEIDTRLISDLRTLRTRINLSGRPSVCSPAARRVIDTPVCS